MQNLVVKNFTVTGVQSSSVVQKSNLQASSRTVNEQAKRIIPVKRCSNKRINIVMNELSHLKEEVISRQYSKAVIRLKIHAQLFGLFNSINLKNCHIRNKTRALLTLNIHRPDYDYSLNTVTRWAIHCSKYSSDKFSGLYLKEDQEQ